MIIKKNVYLFDLGTGTNRNLLPLSIGLVGSYSMSLNDLNDAYNFEFQFLRDTPKATVDTLNEPYVVAVSTYVWNLHASLALVKEIRKRFPHTLIVLGGYSIPKYPDRIVQFFGQNPEVDVLIHGEGEFTFADMLKRLLIDRDLSQVNGLTFRCLDVEEGYISTPRRERIENLNELPSPFLNGVYDRLIEQHGDLVTGAVWETSRGCPYSCTFCDWGNADVVKVKRFDTERLKEELKWMSKNKIYYIYGADANFGIFFERDLEIIEYLSDLCEATSFPGYLMINWLKNSHERIVTLAERLKKGGVITNVTLALQSMNSDTLSAIKRRNIKQDSMHQLKKEFHDKRLPTYIELILGLPMETYESFVFGIDEICTPRLDDHFVIYLCTLLENTEMSSEKYREEYHLQTRNCSIGMSRREFYENMEMEELVVGTSTMPTQDWEKAYVFGYFFSVLYNHRAAFFILNYLNHDFGISRTDLVIYFINEIRSNPDNYSCMAFGLAHLDKQKQLILDNISSTSSPDGLEGIYMSPHEGTLPLLIRNIEALSEDLKRLVLRFTEVNKIELDEEILNDVLLYQKVCMPIWPVPVMVEYEFNSTVPEYFEKLVLGLEPKPIKKIKTAINVKVHDNYPNTYEEFATNIVRAGHTVQTFDVDVVGYALSIMP
jgi:radical SAM superfamily enzyme YgiQ (UPF0313 family)